MKNKILTNLIRFGFAGWIVFELLNYVEILHFTLDFSWLGLVLTSGFVWGAIEIISFRLKKSTGKPLSWLVYLGGFLSVSLDALGDVAHWYSEFEWYDQLGHASGGGMAALLSFFVFWQLKEAGKISIGKKLAGFMGIVTAMALGVLYEMEEYIEDIFSGGNRLGSGIDTANDMMWNTIGALIVVIIAVKIINASHSEQEEHNEE